MEKIGQDIHILAYHIEITLLSRSVIFRSLYTVVLCLPVQTNKGHILFGCSSLYHPSGEIALLLVSLVKIESYWKNWKCYILKNSWFTIIIMPAKTSSMPLSFTQNKAKHWLYKVWCNVYMNNWTWKNHFKKNIKEYCQTKPKCGSAYFVHTQKPWM